MLSASREIPALRDTEVTDASPGRILDRERFAEIRRGFRRLLEAGPGMEPHLRGVLSDSLDHPGGLLRAQLTYGLLTDGEVDPEKSLSMAIAVEYFHTASLLLDDLPSMDDGLERRGQPCAHRVHGESATILGALGLITRSYGLLWQGISDLPENRRRLAGELVEQCLGVDGILEGQARDLHFDQAPDGAGAVEEVAAGKTSTLFRLCLELPALAAGVDLDLLVRLKDLASSWGLVYQGLDDFKDLLESSAESGKTGHRDDALGRPNLARAAGFNGARRRLESLLGEARSTVSELITESPRWQLLRSVQSTLEAHAEKLFGRLGDAPKPSQHPRPRSTAPSGALAFAQQEMRRWGQTQRTLVLSVPAPEQAMESFFDLMPSQEGVFWQRGADSAWAGSGAVHHLVADRESRFLSLQAQAARLGRDLVTAATGVPEERPRFFGGLAFEAGGAQDPPWKGFGDAHFVLPRFVYGRSSQGPILSLAVRGDEIAYTAGRRQWLDRLESTLSRLAQPPAPAAGRVCVLHTERPSEEEWTARVSELTRDIRRGKLLKVVTARQSKVTLASAPAIGPLLSRMPAPPESFRYAFRHAGATFLGATPERLIALRDGRFETEAVAGTIPACGNPLNWDSAGAKLRLEHRLVVQEIERRIAPLCSSRHTSPKPQSRTHGRVVHFRTPIHGTLRARHHVLELVATLHPTPAVGGLPTPEALRWISAHEPVARGWYAAPVGWFDTAGNGEFAVALRCALIRGPGAFVYTGAGIVQGSDPQEEAAEVDLKERTLLEALEG